MIAFPPPGRLDPKKLPDISTLVKRKGDARRGKQLLSASIKNDMACMKCHTIRGDRRPGRAGPVDDRQEGQPGEPVRVDPPAQQGGRRSVRHLDHRDHQGQDLSGLLVEETPQAVTLRDANGKDTRVPAKEIEAKTKSPNSLMPERPARLHDRRRPGGRGRIPVCSQDADPGNGLLAHRRPVRQRSR